MGEQSHPYAGTQFNNSEALYGVANQSYTDALSYLGGAQDFANTNMRQQQAWGQQQVDAAGAIADDNFNRSRGYSASALASGNEVRDRNRIYSDASLTAANTDRERYNSQFVPLEGQLVNDANSYASNDRKELMRGRATAEVANQFNVARNASQQQLESYGINPASTRYAALDIGVRTQQAAASAAAANNSDLQVEQTGRDIRNQAIALGLNVNNRASAGYGQASQFDQAGLGASLAGTNAAIGYDQAGANGRLAAANLGGQLLGTGQSWAGLRNQAISGIAGVGASAIGGATGYTNAANTGEQQARSSSSGIGSLLGAGASLFGQSGAFGGGGAFGAMGAFALAEGGQVPEFTSPSSGAIPDDVPARLTPGEFVVPKDVMSWLGEKNVQNMIVKARKEKEGAVAKPTYAIAAPQPTAFATALPAR